MQRTETAMRWKLIVLSSVIATTINAGLTWSVILSTWGNPSRLHNASLGVIAILFIPILATLFAAIFVYRHTARRRSVQAMATALLTCLLTLLTFFMVTSYSTQKKEPVLSDGPVQHL